MEFEALKKRLEEQQALLEENNRLLHKIRRTQRTASFFSTLYWIAIIAVTFGAYFYIQPLIQSFTQLLPGMNGTSGLEQIQKNAMITDIEGIQKLLNSLNTPE